MKRQARRVLGLLLILLLVYGGLALIALVFAERIIFQPPSPTYGAGTMRTVLVPVGPGGRDSVAVVHLPNDSARYTILYSHGNAEDLGWLLPVLEFVRDLGFSVVGYDYRGYGRSTGGPPSAMKAVEDAEAVYRHVVNRLGVAPERLILYGSSVGSGPTLELAIRHPSAGVILQSAFTSTFRVITRVRLLPFDRFPNLERVRGLRRPLLVIHGTRDFVVPFGHGRRLFAEASEPKQALWVDGAGHNDVIVLAGARYSEALRRFADLLDEQERAE